MNISDVPRRRRWRRFSVAVLLAGVLAGAGCPGVEAATAGLVPVAAASSSEAPVPSPFATQAATPLTGQTAGTQEPAAVPSEDSGPAVPATAPSSPAAVPGTSTPEPEPTGAGQTADPAPSSPAPATEQPGTGRPDTGQTAAPQPAPAPGGNGTGAGPDPGAGPDQDAESGAAGESPDNLRPARLRLVQEFNVPKADYGRYWTLAARQQGKTLFAGSGPKTPAKGFGTIAAGTATVLSARMDPGWSRAGEVAGRTAWNCRDDRTGDAVAVRGGNTLVPLEPGQQVVCAASVQLRDGALAVTKSRAVLKEESPGRWNLSYEIRVTNTSRTADGSYGLAETLDFGKGIAVVSAAWTGDGRSGAWPDPDRNRTAPLAPAGTAIGHSAGTETVHTYRVTAVVTVPPDTPAPDLQCRPGEEDSGGLSSIALLNQRVQAAACRTVPVRVRVDKVWSINGTEYRHGSQPDGFGATLHLSAPGTVEPAGGTKLGRVRPQWGLVTGRYRPGMLLTVAENVSLPKGCTVAGTGGSGARRLSTAVTVFTIRTLVECEQRLTLVNRLAPQDLAPGLSGKWTLTAVAEGARQATVSGTSGTSRRVEAGTSYRLGEDRSFAGAAEFTARPWNCRLDSGDGKLVQQGSSITPGYGQQITCTVANTWRRPALEVSKNAGRPTPVPGTSGTQWDVVYGISVNNPSMVSSARYTLVDWLAFGHGVEIVSAKWMLPGSALSGRWTEPDSFPLATLASGRAIDVMDRHDYLVAVRVRVKPGTAARELDCLPDDSGETGLLNMVALNGNTVEQACAALDIAVGGGQPAAGGVPIPPADRHSAAKGQQVVPPEAKMPAEAPETAPELVLLSPVLAASSVDRVGAVTATGMLVLSAALVLFLSKSRRH